MTGLILILIIQMLLALGYGYRARKNGKPVPLEKMTITALIPIVGVIIPYTGRFFQFKTVEALSDVFTRDKFEFKNDIRYLKKSDIEEEINTIPVEEALILNSSNIKRKLIMDTAKENAYEYITFLKLAVKDQDMETSHYAASLIMEIKRNLQNLMQSLSVAHETNPEDLPIIEHYLDVVGKYYHSGLLDEKNEERYAYIYSGLLKKRLDKKANSDYWLEEKIEVDFRLQDLKSAEYWIDVYYREFPDSEKPYLLLLRYYYQIGAQDLFEKALRMLKDSHIKLSRKGLDIIRYWTDGRDGDGQAK